MDTAGFAKKLGQQDEDWDVEAHAGRFERLQAITAILSVGVAGALGVLAWRTEGGQQLGYFMAAVLTTQVLLAVGTYLGLYRATISTVPWLLRGNTYLVSSGVSTEAFLARLSDDDDLLFAPAAQDFDAALDLARKASARCPTTVVVPPSMAHKLDSISHDVKCILSFVEPQLSYGLMGRDPHRRVILYSPAGGHWIILPEEEGSKSLAQRLAKSVVDRTFDIGLAANPSWLASKVYEASATWSRTASNLNQGRIECITPNEIYTEQLRLSDGAKTIHALDMTEISEWFEDHGLGGCIVHNARTAQKYGVGAARRIIFVPSRNYLVERHGYREQLIQVLRMHVDGGIQVGVVFQTDLSDKSLIVDSVLYRGTVLWVETTPTTRFAGTGYFTTRTAEVEAFKQRFERLWRGEFCPNPELEASRLLADGPGSSSIPAQLTA